MYEDDQDADQWQQQQDAELQEQLYLDCLLAIYKDYEGTADIFAAGLGMSKQWRQTKDQLNAHARTARVA